LGISSFVIGGDHRPTARLCNTISSLFFIAAPMLPRLLDKLVLCPSRHPIPVAGKSRRLVEVDDDRVEIWTHRNGEHSTDDAELFVLKFPGTGGRAERGTDHPVEYWPDVKAELWTVNPPGYGCSSGRAQLVKLPRMADAVYEELASVAGDRPIVVTGNSLGTATALHTAAHHPVAALVLRNVIPLQQLIVGHHGWKSLWMGAWLISRAVPDQLDSIANAARATAPCVFVMSGRDRTVPPRFQQPVIDAYAGPHRLMLLPDADHADFLTDEEKLLYAEHLAWLRGEVFSS
jgi:pimeloyl-ACP methyl ester carboxylesterase